MSVATVVRPQAGVTSGEGRRVPDVQSPDPFTLVIFGATGDLAARKLLPALGSLWHRRFLPREFAIVGVSRRDKNDRAFREDVRGASAAFRKDLPAPTDERDGFLGHVFYQQADFTTSDGMRGLSGRLQETSTGMAGPTWPSSVPVAIR